MFQGRILLTGSTGMIGTSVVRSLRDQRISAIALHRKKNRGASVSAEGEPTWDPYAAVPFPEPDKLAGVTGAIHLSGANLAGHRWTAAYKREISESRVQPTRALAIALAKLRPRPSVLVVASAIGIYGDRGDEELTENASQGSGFLPDVCLAWEQAARPAEDAGIRVVHARFGVVLARGGGALGQMLPIFRLGLGGKLGDGRQWMSWVTLEDVSRAILFALQREELRGPANVVAPQPVTNAQFTRTLGRVLHRPAVFQVPGFALRLAFGEMADDTVLTSQRVVPARLLEAGFTFNQPELEAGLRAILSANPRLTASALGSK